MEEHQQSKPSGPTLKTAYQQVLARRHINASVLKWSLAYAKADRERRNSMEGVTLYIL